MRPVPQDRRRKRDDSSLRVAAINFKYVKERIMSRSIING